MASRQREQARAGGQYALLRERVTELTSKLVDTNEQLTKTETIRLKLEQENRGEM